MRAPGAGVTLSNNALDAQVSGAASFKGTTIALTSPATRLSLGTTATLQAPQFAISASSPTQFAANSSTKPPTTIELRDELGTPMAHQHYIVATKSRRIGGILDDKGQDVVPLSEGDTVDFPDVGNLHGVPRVSASQLRPYVVRQGDHVAQIAYRNNLNAADVWDHPKNSELKQRRGDGQMLCPGDVIHIPTARRDGAPLQIASTNTYTATPPTVRVELRFVQQDKPLTNEPYEVHGVAGAPVVGVTDSDGNLAFDAPVTARSAAVSFTALRLRYTVLLGDLDPIDEPSGLRQRLEQLHYQLHVGPSVDIDTAEWNRHALRAFQHLHGLPETGELDDRSRELLLKEHGE